MVVFNKRGQYIDNFYLQLDESLLHVHNDYLFALETDEKGNPEVVQYRILN